MMNSSIPSKTDEFKPIAFEVPTGYPYNLLPTGQQFELYVQSPAGRSREAAFYDYLLICVHEYPNECIELASSFDTHEGQDICYRHLDYQPVEVVMQAYNALKDYKYSLPGLEAAMDLFDRMLKQPYTAMKHGKESPILSDVT